MSTEAVNQFLENIRKDQQLAQELVEALQKENYKQIVTDLASNKGYQVTSEELWAEIEKRQADFQKRQEAGELTDEELELVAGGFNWEKAVASAVVSGIVTGITVPFVPSF